MPAAQTLNVQRSTLNGRGEVAREVNGFPTGESSANRGIENQESNNRQNA
jgi:hypothetical protein